jgi:hypothetical protein
LEIGSARNIAHRRAYEGGHVVMGVVVVSVCGTRNVLAVVLSARQLSTRQQAA